jgi:hypothetical protein
MRASDATAWIVCVLRIVRVDAKDEVLSLSYPAVPRKGDLLLVGTRHFRVEDVEWAHTGGSDAIAVPLLHSHEVM